MFAKRYFCGILASLVIWAAAPTAVLAESGQDLVDEIFDIRRGLYVSGTWGLTFDHTIDSNALVGGGRALLTFDEPAQAFTVAVGTYLGPFRAEFETGFRDTDALTSEPLSLGETVDGDLEYLSFLGNLFYDIPTPVVGVPSRL